jgi:hypothetical protein
LSENFNKHQLERKVAGGKAKRMIQPEGKNCLIQTTEKVKQGTYQFCSVKLHRGSCSEKYHP